MLHKIEKQRLLKILLSVWVNYPNQIKTKLADDSKKENCFPVWIADESEAPFRTSLYLKIGCQPRNPEDYHIQWEISKEQREAIRGFSQPINIYMDPTKVFFVHK